MKEHEREHKKIEEESEENKIKKNRNEKKNLGRTRKWRMWRSIRRQENRMRTRGTKVGVLYCSLRKYLLLVAWCNAGISIVTGCSKH
jgi:hypothetical protein